MANDNQEDSLALVAQRVRGNAKQLADTGGGSRKSLCGMRAHSVPCSVRAQGSHGQSEISSSSSPRAPITAGLEQRIPRFRRRSQSSPTAHRHYSLPVKQASRAGLRSVVSAWPTISSSRASLCGCESVNGVSTANFVTANRKRCNYRTV